MRERNESEVDAAPVDPPSPALALVLGLVWPGLGHVYLGQRAKGVIVMVGAPLSCCGLGLFNLLAAADGWSLARAVQRGRRLGRWENSRVAEWLDTL